MRSITHHQAVKLMDNQVQYFMACRKKLAGPDGEGRMLEVPVPYTNNVIHIIKKHGQFLYRLNRR